MNEQCPICGAQCYVLESCGMCAGCCEQEHSFDYDDDSDEEEDDEF